MSHKKWDHSSQVLGCKNQKILSEHRSFFTFFSNLENPLKYGLTFVVAVFIVGFLWYVSLSPTLVPDQDLVKIKPLEGAFKIKPIEEVVDEEKQHSKTIYEKLEAKNPDEKVEHLLKEPEEPIALPPSLPDDSIGSLLNEEEIPEASSGSDKKTTNEQSEENVKQEDISPKILEEFERDQKSSKDEISAQENSKSLPEIKEKVEFKELSQTENSSQISRVVSKSKDNISQKEMFWIQLASLRSKEAAEREWKRLSRASKTKFLLGSFKPFFSQSGEKDAICYRVRIGPFSEEQAKDIYQKLKALKIDCLMKKVS